MSPHMLSKRFKVSYSRSVSPASLSVPPPPASSASGCHWLSSASAATEDCSPLAPTYHTADDVSFADGFPQPWDHIFQGPVAQGCASPALATGGGPSASATADWVDLQGPGSPNRTADLGSADNAMTQVASQDAADLANPFVDNACEWIATLGQSMGYKNTVEINGYIKCRFPQQAMPRQKDRSRTVPIFESYTRSSGLKRPLSLMSNGPSASSSSPAGEYWPDPTDRACEQREVPRLPPGFGFKKMSGPDRQLFMFYRNAWCVGRTILPNTNCWLTAIPAMAAQSPGVEHAMLALAGTYVLDYLPDDRVRHRSNNHYNQAVTMLTDALNVLGASSKRPVDSEALVACIALLNMMDVISPERRRPKDLPPRWLEGGEVACRILSMTDEGFRYNNPAGAQPSANRIANTIISSRVVIVALPMTPLRYITTSDERFSFLSAQATERATRQIHGACGCSPRLLQRFAQITEVASMQEEDQFHSVYLSSIVKRLRLELRNLRQWALIPDDDMSEGASARREHEGYPSTEALLEACDESLAPGQHIVKDKISMTFLTAEAWRIAAIIYFQCRVLRLPRRHGQVLANFDSLAACIRRMPTSGPLFTAQAPFFPVFLLGLMAPQQRPDLRRCAQAWFEAVTSTSCRSSVPPAYEAMKRIQKWMDGRSLESDDENLPELVGHRNPWWEEVVHYIKNEEGVLCLV